MFFELNPGLPKSVDAVKAAQVYSDIDQFSGKICIVQKRDAVATEL